MIVFPMAGLSRRFADAGYTLPKYVLPVHGRSLFSHAVLSFESEFQTETFVFAYREVDGTRAFIEYECQALGIREVVLHELPGPTAGQADTVDRAVAAALTGGDESLLVFNIDTVRRNWVRPAFLDDRTVAGYLEVVQAPGEGWSFVEPGPGGTVLRTAEKERISDLCSTGLYFFSSAGAFRDAFARARRDGLTVRGEYYVAPLYNILIADGAMIRYEEIPRADVAFSGVPAEYEELARRSDGIWGR